MRPRENTENRNKQPPSFGYLPLGSADFPGIELFERRRSANFSVQVRSARRSEFLCPHRVPDGAHAAADRAHLWCSAGSGAASLRTAATLRCTHHSSATV
jgi:hypothetical protein